MAPAVHTVMVALAVLTEMTEVPAASRISELTYLCKPLAAGEGVVVLPQALPALEEEAAARAQLGRPVRMRARSTAEALAPRPATTRPAVSAGAAVRSRRTSRAGRSTAVVVVPDGQTRLPRWTQAPASMAAAAAGAAGL